MSPRNDLCIYVEIHESEGDGSDRDLLKVLSHRITTKHHCKLPLHMLTFEFYYFLEVLACNDIMVYIIFSLFNSTASMSTSSHQTFTAEYL